MTTIPKNHTKAVAAIFARTVTCHVHEEYNGFQAVPVNVELAAKDLAEAMRAKLRIDDDATHATVHVHGNLWYNLTLQPES